MNIDIYKSLTEQKKEIKNQLNNLNDEITKLETISFKERIIYCLSLSLTPYLITLQLSKTLLNLELIPNTIINYLTIGTSLTIGIINEYSILNKFHYPSLWQNLKNFKTNEEKKLKYKIKIKKLENQIKLLEKLEKIEPNIFYQNDSIISQISPKILTNDRIKHLELILKEKLQYLNILSTKKTLIENFKQERQNLKTILFQRNFQSLYYSLLTTTIFNLPNLYAQETITCLTKTTIIIPLLLSYLTIYSYQSIKFKKNLELFKKFNSKLKDNSLPKTENYQTEKNFDKELEDYITNIIQIKSELNNEKLKILIPLYIMHQQHNYNTNIKTISDQNITSTQQEQNTIIPIIKRKRKTHINHHVN